MTVDFAALLLLLASGIPALLFMANAIRYRRAPLGAVRGSEGISVVIPARNEEEAIGPAIDVVLANRDLDLEVIVVDDASEDRTIACVKQRMASDPRVRLVSSPPLPPGWNGKQHACDVGGRAATRSHLLFLDADVRLQPGAPQRLLAFLRQSGASLVSGAPRQITGTWMERLLVPLIHFVLLAFLPMGRMRRSRSPAYSAGIGQLFFARRDHWLAAGGHAAIRATRHDGLALPAAFRRVGFATDLVDATDLATCRMYTNAPDVWNGFLKNAHEGLGRNSLILPTSILLLTGQVLPFALLPFLPILPTPIAFAAPLAAILALIPRLAGALRFRQSLLGAALHPLGVLLLVAIQFHSLLRRLRGMPTAWKGRAALATGAILLAVCIGAPSSSMAASGPQPTARERAEILEGSVILRFSRADGDSGAGTFTGFVGLDASSDQVWAAVLDFEDLARRSSIVKDVYRTADFVGPDGRRIVDLAYRLDVLGNEIRYNLHHVFDPTNERLEWTLDRTRENDISALQGSFETRSEDGRTLLVYQSHVITGRFIPAGVEIRLREVILRRFLAGVREEIEED